MSIMTRNTLGDAFLKGMSAKLLEIKDQADKDYSLATNNVVAIEGNASTELFKKITSQNARETIGGLTQFGDMELTAETEDYKVDTYGSTYLTQIDFKKYTKRVTISEENRDDAIVGAKLEQTGHLYTAGKRTMNKHMFDVLNYGFTAEASLPEHLFTYNNGKALFSVSQPLKYGTSTTTDSNADANGIPLTETNLELARIALKEQLDDRGNLLSYGSGALMLVVPHTLEKLAAIITKGVKRSNTANNDVNIYDGIVTVISSKWLSAANGGSDTAWYLVDAMSSPLLFVERNPLTIKGPNINYSNYNINIDISSRYRAGNRDWRGIWGSKGDAATYSS